MAQDKKGVLTQGTNVWLLHGKPAVLTKMNCVKALVLGDDSATEINSTCLEEPDTATSMYGLNTPGEGSLQIDTDPKNQSHMTLLKLAGDKELVGVYVGWSDGKSEPTLTGEAVTLPEDRTFSSFTAILRKGNAVFDADALVNHTIPMKRQSEVVEDWKTE